MRRLVNPPSGLMSGAAVLCLWQLPVHRMVSVAPPWRPSPVGCSSMSKSGRKQVQGVTVSAQVIAFLAVALLLTGGVGFAVLRWLEGTS